MKEGKPSLGAFTTFRFFAALAVLGHHLGECAQDRRFAHLYNRWLYEGYSGVTFFFILSGFILTYNYHDAFTTLGIRKIWDFYTARFARIYPVHALTFLAFFLLSPVVVKTVVAQSWTLAANLTLTQSFVPSAPVYFSQNAVSWSLSVEMVFYALLPLILWALSRPRLKGPWKALLVGTSAWAVAFGVNWLYRDSASSHWLFYINPLFRLQDFLVGAALALFLTARDRPAPRPGKALGTLLEAASLAGLLGAAALVRLAPVAVRLGTYYTPFMALVIFVFSFESGYLSMLLRFRPLQFLGEISFSMYMFHQIVHHFLLNNKEDLGLGGFGVLRFTPVYLAAVLGVSALCYCCYETPMRLGLKLLLQRNSQPRPLVSSPAPSAVARAA